ncbi:unnamed protein product [Linum tenue]|uniref:Uncharacterized protein n=1 Tax=Linum tenue TaxID=586396 RepID=A0AAV0NTE2_9ROSI|nr:unnamed protein product [Linum tenue]
MVGDNFTSYFYTALRGRRILTYIDDSRIEDGGGGVLEELSQFGVVPGRIGGDSPVPEATSRWFTGVLPAESRRCWGTEGEL